MAKPIKEKMMGKLLKCDAIVNPEQEGVLPFAYKNTDEGIVVAWRLDKEDLEIVKRDGVIYIEFVGHNRIPIHALTVDEFDALSFDGVGHATA